MTTSFHSSSLYLSTGLNLFSANLMPARRKPCYALSSKKQLPKLFWWQKSLLCKNEMVGIWRRKYYIVLLYIMCSLMLWNRSTKSLMKEEKNKGLSRFQKRPNIKTGLLKSPQISFQFFVCKKFRKWFYLFICILPDIVVHENKKKIWQNSHFENRTADLPLRWEISIR